jgi:hypothetical protein
MSHLLGHHVSEATPYFCVVLLVLLEGACTGFTHARTHAHKGVHKLKTENRAVETVHKSSDLHSFIKAQYVLLIVNLLKWYMAP